MRPKCCGFSVLFLPKLAWRLLKSNCPNAQWDWKHSFGRFPVGWICLFPTLCREVSLWHIQELQWGETLLKAGGRKTLMWAEKKPCSCFALRDRRKGPPGNKVGWFDGVIVSIATWFLPNGAQHTPSPAHPLSQATGRMLWSPLLTHLHQARSTLPCFWQNKLTTSWRGIKAFVPLAQFLLASREPLQRTEQGVLH